MTADRGINPYKTTLLVVMTLPFLYPFVFLVGTALKPLSDFNDNAISLPGHPTTANIAGAWSFADLGWAGLHSIISVGIGVLLTVAISASGAFWFMRHRGRWAGALRILIIGTMAVPPPVFIIPLFVLLSSWGLTNNLIALGVVYAAWNASFGLYLLHAYFKSIPAELIEAAELDGASPLQMFRHVVLPLAKPALATLAVLAFVWSWSDLLISVVLVQDAGKRTLTTAVTLLADQFSTNIPRNAAGVLLALIPMLVVFLYGQRFLVRGILAGVGK